MRYNCNYSEHDVSNDVKKAYSLLPSDDDIQAANELELGEDRFISAAMKCARVFVQA
jgi:hypothetical protein